MEGADMKTDNELIATMENNCLIAEFMGWKKILNGDLYYHDNPPLWATKQQGKFFFDVSWDWLMPVVEKISKYYYEEFKSNNGYKNITEYDYAYPRTFAMLNNSGKFMVRINRMTLHEDESLIKATYEAVVEFIKWYNEQSKI
jgi:hypothetical protein